MSEINIIEGDSLKYLMTMDDQSVDVIIADPPYGGGKLQANGGWFRDKYGGTKKWNVKPPSIAFAEILRVGKHVVIWGANNFASELPDSTCWAVWSKPNIPKTGFSMTKCELAWTNLASLKVLYCEQSSIRKKHWAAKHPTAKPFEVYDQLLTEIEYVIKDDLTGKSFLDPYLGCGLSLIAAEKHGMGRITGIEADPDYVKLARENQRRKFFVDL